MRNATAIMVVVCLAMAAPAFGDWTGGANDGGKWNTPANWDSNVVPNGTALISGSHTVVVNPDALYAIGNLKVRDGAKLTIEADLTVGGYAEVDASSSVDISGGSFSSVEIFFIKGTVRIIGDGATITVPTITGPGGALEMVFKNGGISTFVNLGTMVLPDTLVVTLDGTFVLPTVTTTYDLVTAGTMSGDTFTTVSLPSTDWSLDYTDGTAVQLTYAVPEPATMSLLAIGGLGMLLKRRRRA